MFLLILQCEWLLELCAHGLAPDKHWLIDRLICQVFVRREELTWHAPVCLGVSTIERDGVTLCDVCQSQFTDVRLFREHYQVHTHPYRCDKCGKRFIKVRSCSG